MRLPAWGPYVWAKTDPADRNNPQRYLWLPCHLLNVGEVARAVLLHPGARPWQTRLAEALGCPVEQLVGPVSLLIGLHDMGKACPQFAKRSIPHWRELEVRGAPELLLSEQDWTHAMEGQCYLESWLGENDAPIRSDQEWERDLTSRLALAIGGHHGRFKERRRQRSMRWRPQVEYRPKPDNTRECEWAGVRTEFLRLVQAQLLETDTPLFCSPTNLSAACILLNGLSILADWIGSDEALFEPIGLLDGEDAWKAYAAWSRGQARQAVETRGLLRHLPQRADGEEPTFAVLFGKEKTPRPLQRALEPERLPDLPFPGLLLIEGPMGEGKTEAALMLAQRYASRTAAGGFYFALPTMATSNQMFERVLEYLQEWTPAGNQVEAILVNGRAELNRQVLDLLKIRRADEAAQLAAVPEEDRQENRVALDSWLMPRKQSLLAPHGVGTVDQAMFGAMNVPHVGLRLLGLAGKVVIIDEVHAYDVYMTTILRRLLHWLRELGAPVILLSATLAAAQRRELLEAYGIMPGPKVEHPPYPCLVAGRPGEEAEVTCLGAGSRPLTVTVEYCREEQGWDRKRVARELLRRVRRGGCAAWICNTVAEAQEAYLAACRELQEQPAERVEGAQETRLILFHARFLLEDRQNLEEQVRKLFGPGSDRPPSALLIGTQVLEQSLNYDVDLMASELAPVDLLLQRMGRLWRFEETRRGPGLEKPHLMLLAPRVDPDKPEFRPYGAFYQPLILLKTLVALKDLPGDEGTGTRRLELPGRIRRLVERVYDSRPLEEQEYGGRRETEAIREASGVGETGIQEALKRRDDDEKKRAEAAAKVLLGEPDPYGKFTAQDYIRLSGDEEESAEAVAMVTRWGEPTARLVVLDAEDELGQRLSRNQGSLTPNEVERLLLRTVSVQKRELTRFLYPEDGSVPAEEVYPLAFQRVSALRGYRLIRLTGGAWEWAYDGRTWRLRLHPKLGLVIEKENG